MKNNPALSAFPQLKHGMRHLMICIIKRIFIAVCICLSADSIYAQVTKGNAILGGSISYETTKYSDNGDRVGAFTFMPGVGYFFLDRLAGGLRVSYTQIFDEGDGFRDFTAGPFARYYFLPVTKSTNIFLEGQFLWGSEKYEGFPGENKNGYGFTAGPVFFINPHIGLEMMAGWRSLKYKTDRGRYNTAWIGAGLQVHLDIFRFKQGK